MAIDVKRSFLYPDIIYNRKMDVPIDRNLIIIIILTSSPACFYGRRGFLVVGTVAPKGRNQVAHLDPHVYIRGSHSEDAPAGQPAVYTPPAPSPEDVIHA